MTETRIERLKSLRAGGNVYERAGKAIVTILQNTEHGDMESSDLQRLVTEAGFTVNAFRTARKRMVASGELLVYKPGPYDPWFTALAEWPESECETLALIPPEQIVEAQVLNDVDQVCQAFCDAYKVARPNARLKAASITAKQRKLIKDMLKAWDLETICDALAWNGQAAKRAGGNTLKFFRASTVFRNEGNFARMIEAAEAGEVEGAMSAETQSVLADFVRMGGDQ